MTVTVPPTLTLDGVADRVKVGVPRMKLAVTVAGPLTVRLWGEFPETVPVKQTLQGES